MKRFLKPMLAGAALLTLAVPALASAQSYYGGRGDYAGDDLGDYGRGYRAEAPRWDRHFDYRDRDYYRRHHDNDRRFAHGWSRGGWR